MKLEDIIDTPINLSVKTDKTDNSVKRVYMTFSVGSSPVEVEKVPEAHNFSEDPTSLSIYNEITSFSIRERIRESKFTPKIILRRRIRDVAMYCRSVSADKVKLYRKVMIDYISEFVYKQITSLVSNPSVGQFNLILLLGLNMIMINTQSTRNFQRIMLRVKRYLLTKGVIPLTMQKKLSEAYSEFWKDLLKSIDIKFMPKNKQGILPGSDSEADSESKKLIVAFSESKLKANELKNDKDLLDYLETYFNNITDKTKAKDIIDELNKIKKSSPELFKSKGMYKDFLKSELLGDELLTKYIANYLWTNKDLVQLTRYLTDSLEPPEVLNFSSCAIVPMGLQWSPDHKICYVPPRNYRWYKFIIDDTDKDKVKVYSISYPTTVPFKSNINESSEAIKSEVSFENEIDARKYIYETIKTIDNEVVNFSEKGKELIWSELLNTKDYRLGYFIIGKSRYELLLYKYNNMYNLEVRIFDESVPISKNIDDHTKNPPDKIYSDITKDQVINILHDYSIGKII